MRSLPKDEQLARAFSAAFGHGRFRRQLENGRAMVYRPGALAWTATRAILISEGSVERGDPDDFGALAVHYLIPEGTRFKIASAYLEGVGGSLMGGPPKWVVSTDFGANPVIVSETFGFWQGISCTTTSLYELGGAAPVSLGAFPSGYDNIGAEGQGPKAVSIVGSIRNIVSGKSFEVDFDGTSNFKQVFERRGAKYVKVQGNGKLPTC